jgi:hypothetical protein
MCLPFLSGYASCQPELAIQPKNKLKPWLIEQLCIPAKQNALFVYQMEDVLRVYTRPYDPRFPRLCMDERSLAVARGQISFYEAFAPEEAERLCEKLESHYTPKHGSWLDMAEIELALLGFASLDPAL